ncbi:hypothetical protein [Shinella oryzae]|uniref:hypothetical protein n=1 Tax=Shinella oryzae TaxID=2871820 RepID=UPI001FF0F631|nr:hypothetical protein [Shinella oryzae]UPA25358.1 hypothetical protein K6301_03910 [Shinella oryzae]
MWLIALTPLAILIVAILIMAPMGLFGFLTESSQKKEEEKRLKEEREEIERRSAHIRSLPRIDVDKSSKEIIERLHAKYNLSGVYDGKLMYARWAISNHGSPLRDGQMDILASTYRRKPIKYLGYVGSDYDVLAEIGIFPVEKDIDRMIFVMISNRSPQFDGLARQFAKHAGIQTYTVDENLRLEFFQTNSVDEAIDVTSKLVEYIVRNSPNHKFVAVSSPR